LGKALTIISRAIGNWSVSRYWYKCRCRFWRPM